jgi:predicted hotdog family 3-hydroxylacyl-ACP dehydratase
MAPAPPAPGIEDLLPHRGRMLLIDEIVNIDKDAAVSRATPTDQWPLCDGSRVSPLLIIELVAQTSGLSNGLERLTAEGPGTETKGWLVGVRKAIFHVPAIALGEVIVTEAKNSFKFEGFREIEGCCRVGGKIVGEVTLQVVRAGQGAGD